MAFCTKGDVADSMAEKKEIEALDAGDEIQWQCPECDQWFTKQVGKGIVMSLVSKGSVSLPCSACNTTVEVNIDWIKPTGASPDQAYDATEEYPT